MDSKQSSPQQQALVAIWNASGPNDLLDIMIQYPQAPIAELRMN